MDLFDYMRKNTIEQEAPLASRLRPSTLDEVVGQKHIIGKDKLLYRAIKADKLGSLIFSRKARITFLSGFFARASSEILRISSFSFLVLSSATPFTGRSFCAAFSYAASFSGLTPTIST